MRDGWAASQVDSEIQVWPRTCHSVGGKSRGVEEQVKAVASPRYHRRRNFLSSNPFRRLTRPRTSVRNSSVSAKAASKRR
jgi:hypothetical protein